jgi:hypothetical protein
MKMQRGITFIGFLMVLVVVGFFAYAAMRLVPVYTEYFSVVKAMKAVAGEVGVASKQPGDIRNMLLRHFDISYVDSVRPNDIRISRDRNPSINIAYEVRKPFVANIDLLVRFDHSETLNRGAGE